MHSLSRLAALSALVAVGAAAGCSSQEHRYYPSAGVYYTPKSNTYHWIDETGSWRSAMNPPPRVLLSLEGRPERFWLKTEDPTTQHDQVLSRLEVRESRRPAPLEPIPATRWDERSAFVSD